jgi:hypothetical protein
MHENPIILVLLMIIIVVCLLILFKKHDAHRSYKVTSVQAQPKNSFANCKLWQDTWKSGSNACFTKEGASINCKDGLKYCNSICKCEGKDCKGNYDPLQVQSVTYDTDRNGNCV